MERQAIERLTRTVQADELMLTNLKQEAFRLMELEPKVSELERMRKAAEEDYEFYRATLEKANKEEGGQGGMGNMQKMQSPTPPKLNENVTPTMSGCGLNALNPGQHDGEEEPVELSSELHKVIKQSGSCGVNQNDWGRPFSRRVEASTSTLSLRCLSFSKAFLRSDTWDKLWTCPAKRSLPKKGEM